MKSNNPSADLYIPDGTAAAEALGRTTHLAIVAHQDDIEILAYSGIMECFQSRESWFTGVVTTSGAGSPRRGPYADTSDEEMQRVRAREQRKAADVGEYSAVMQLGYASAQIKDAASDDARGDLVAILRATRPEVVYLHNLADKHDTHVATTLRCIEALRQVKSEHRPRQVLGCEVWRNLDWVVDTEKVRLSASQRPNISAALVGVFDSQISGGKRYDLAAVGRRLANATFSESHQTDEDTALVYAVDLTPLAVNDNLSPLDYMTGYIDRFREDVRARIEKFGSA